MLHSPHSEINVCYWSLSRTVCPSLSNFISIIMLIGRGSFSSWGTSREFLYWCPNWCILCGHTAENIPSLSKPGKEHGLSPCSLQWPLAFDVAHFRIPVLTRAMCHWLNSGCARVCDSILAALPHMSLASSADMFQLYLLNAQCLQDAFAM